MSESLKKRLNGRWESLKSERSSWVEHWMDLSQQIQPRGSRFLVTDRNKGWKVNSHIINSTPTWAARTLAAGMMSGITSPARPWFQLVTVDPALNELQSVKDWLERVEGELRLIFARSNLYNAFHTVYSHMAVPGTAVVHLDEDEARSIRAYVHPAGSYCLASAPTLEVDTVLRETSMTVRQMVRRFKEERVSQHVRESFKRGQYDEWIQVLHAVAPREDYEPGRLGPSGKRWASYWWEPGGSSEELLGEGGYEEQPFMAPRWSITGEDVYGVSPGMEILGDCKALQKLEERKGTLINKLAEPPMQGPASLRNQQATLRPGGMNYVDAVSPSQRLAPAHEINPIAVQVVGAEIREHEARIKTGLYADLWLMLAQADGRMTAREVVERQEEKLLQLGTVLERLQTELLDPVVARTFAVAMRQRRLPPPPREIQGQEVRVEYVSILAQAQKLLGTTAIERLASFTVQTAAAKPDILDTVDWDATVQQYGNALGVPPSVIRPEEDVTGIRAHRAQTQKAAMAAQQAETVAGTAKTLSETDTENQNALTSMLRGMNAPA
jgi:hypothetical protein